MPPVDGAWAIEQRGRHHPSTVNDAIRRGEEGKDVGDEVAFVVSETIPICSVGLEVDLFGGPE